MLVLTRKAGQSTLIRPISALSPTITVNELWRDQPINILVLGVLGRSVRLGIQADRQILIWREEAMEWRDEL